MRRSYPTTMLLIPTGIRAHAWNRTGSVEDHRQHIRDTFQGAPSRRAWSQGVGLDRVMGKLGEGLP